MERGDTREPFEEQDALIIGAPAPFQYVEPPLDPESATTEPLDIVPNSDGSPQEEQEEVVRARQYSFRRHWREPLLRILPTRHAPRWYRALAVVGIGAVFFALLLYSAIPNWGMVAGAVLLALLLLAFPVVRELYRWNKRTVLIEHTDTGIRIVYGEPDNVFLGFNGDGDGNVTSLEGSTEFNLRISWPNKLFFWGCGDLLIAGKVETGGSPLLENVPRIKRVRSFLNGEI